MKGKTPALIGNILQTIWLVIYFIVGAGTTVLKAIDALPKTGTWSPSILHAIIFLVLVIVSWVAAAKLEDNTWRTILLVCGIVTAVWFFNWIAGILLVVAYFQSGKKA